MFLLVDNHDSFTFNLYQYLCELGAEVEVVRHRSASAEALCARPWEGVIISPGPGTPNDAGISLDVIAQVSGRIPLLGVCLGHQAIGQYFGGCVVRASAPQHGKASRIRHHGTGIFHDIDPSGIVGRYHSLVLDEVSLPVSLRATAHACDDGAIMGIAHVEHPTWGVQFHPESILSSIGKPLLSNFLRLAAAHRAGAPQ